MKQTATFLKVLPVLAFAFGPALAGASAQDSDTHPNELVRRVVAHELEAAKSRSGYIYRMRKESSKGTETKLMIESSNWLVGSLTRINDKPLSPQQQKKEEDRLAGLLHDAAALHKEEIQAQKNENRVKRMVRVLPNAFRYEYISSSDSGPDGDRVVRLAFAPIPAFQAPTRELKVLTGMKGTIELDVTATRLMRVEATLFRSVSFGWGILARLRPGGTFLLERGPIGYEQWSTRKLDLHFRGSILLFKSLWIDSTITTDQYQSLPGNLTLLQGLEILKKQAEKAAE